MKKPILVIKFGSASVTTASHEIDETVIASVAQQVSFLSKSYNIVLVSSGAVAAGKKKLVNYKGTLSEKKAAAAVGNPLLLQTYSRYFLPYGVSIAQSLCERHHFSNRNQFLQLKKTYEQLWKSNIIPVANENDVVSNLEIKFSDNDELATLIAVGFGAQMVLYCTSVPGVYDDNGKVISEIPLIDRAALSLAKKEKSSVGLGGMTSKLTFARLATQMGIKAVIFGIKSENAIINAVEGKTGTVCLAQNSNISARNKWLASGSIIKGQVQVDDGAVKALLKRHSLLAVGVQKLLRHFEAGEVFEIVDAEKTVIAVAKSKLDSHTLTQQKNKQNIEIAHADDIVLI
ncbi:glutamate 5-kinase [Pelobium manganitolerans]|uniref:glutamate 5-kinase n=1 Tax=Pelobium manganitolerans TaxID=1842495 RepID=UPI003FA3C4A2